MLAFFEIASEWQISKCAPIRQAPNRAKKMWSRPIHGTSPSIFCQRPARPLILISKQEQGIQLSHLPCRYTFFRKSIRRAKSKSTTINQAPTNPDNLIKADKPRTAASAAPNTRLQESGRKVFKKRSAQIRCQFQDRKLLRIFLFCIQFNSNNNPTLHNKQWKTALTCSIAEKVGTCTHNASSMLCIRPTKQKDKPPSCQTHSPTSPNTPSTKSASMRKPIASKQNSLLKSKSRGCTSQNQKSINLTIYSCIPTGVLSNRTK